MRFAIRITLRIAMKGMLLTVCGATALGLLAAMPVQTSAQTGIQTGAQTASPRPTGTAAATAAPAAASQPRHKVKAPRLPQTPSPQGLGESRAEREQRLRRECRGKPNAGACEGYAS